MATRMLSRAPLDTVLNACHDKVTASNVPSTLHGGQQSPSRKGDEGGTGVSERQLVIDSLQLGGEWLSVRPMAGGISLFKNSDTGLFTRDDSILASSLLLASNSLMSRSSEAPSTSTSTPTTATQLYSQFQNYYHLHENGIFPSSLILHPSNTDTATAADSEGYSTQLPNLTASLLRSRSDSLSRRASEPNLQKFGASADNFSTAAAAAASATANGDMMVRQKNTTEQLVRALHGNLLMERDPSLTSTIASSTAQPPTQTSSEAELYQSPMRGTSQVYDEDTEDVVDDDESTIFVQESNDSRTSNGGEECTTTKNNNEITTQIAMTQS
ncbi:unnamed protein product [Hydatigera taeniaeformis]|uniref:SH2 domain-containing protein n=1 Tax=Hydatigena taeniaeformis TaxID=6205 RepID=A0A0R3X367_HYDTA|nr:unnamed protein product [Hydatigera taeniaeformis]